MGRPEQGAAAKVLWERPELRTSFMEGLTAYGPPLWVAAVGALSGALLAPLGVPVWFAVNCLFTDRINWPFDPSACLPLPPLSAGGWLLAAGWLALAGALYLLILRASLRKAALARIGPAAFHPAHLFAVFAAAATCFIMSARLGDPGVSRAEALLFIVSPPVWLRLWWSLRLRAYAAFATRRPREACAWTVRVWLSRQFFLKSPELVDVEAVGGERGSPDLLPVKLFVKGPFDAVDDRRIGDMAGTRLAALVEDVAVETTLSPGEYWRPYREDLGPSGYESPPIPAPLNLPEPLLWLCASVAVVFLGLMLASGAFAPAGKERFEEAIASISRDLEQMEAGLDPTRKTGMDTSFYLINLRDSRTACPELSRDVLARWRLWNESHEDRYVYRVHQVSQVDFYGFVIDGYSHTCIRQEPGRSLREAQYLVASRFAAHEWVRIDDALDWRYVPPRPSPRD